MYRDRSKCPCVSLTTPLPLRRGTTFVTWCNILDTRLLCHAYFSLSVRGHNEMDEPSFTQPTMYSNIVARDRVPDLYLTALSEQGIDTTDITGKELEDYKNFLSEESKKAETYEAEATHLSKQWTGIESAQKGVVTHFDTGKIVNYRSDRSLKKRDISYLDEIKFVVFL